MHSGRMEIAEIEKEILKSSLGKYKNYDKYKIISTGDNIIPDNVQMFINNQISKEIEQGYIECKYKNQDGKIIYYQIPLDKLHSITYIYDKYLSPNKVIRMHQTEEEYKKSKKQLQPIYLNYELDLTHTPTIGNFVNNKTITKGIYYIDTRK